MAALACSKRWIENWLLFALLVDGETPPICLGEARLLQKDAVLVEAQPARAEQLRCNACEVAAKDHISDVTVIPAKSAASSYIAFLPQKQHIHQLLGQGIGRPACNHGAQLSGSCCSHIIWRSFLA